MAKLSDIYTRGEVAQTTSPIVENTNGSSKLYDTYSRNGSAPTHQNVALNNTTPIPSGTSIENRGYGSTIKSGKVYNLSNGASVHESDINKWLDSNYRMSADEQKLAKQFSKDYRAVNKVGTNQNAVRKYLESLSDEDRNTAMLADKIGAKASNISSFVGGFLNATPFATKAVDKAEKALGYGDDYTTSAYLSEQQKQSPLAYGGGAFASKAMQYGMLKQLPAFQKLSGSISKPLGGQELTKEAIAELAKNGSTKELVKILGANAVGNIASDTLADIALDTTPELIDNIQKGKTGGEIAKDTAKNIGWNVLFNVLPEAYGAGKVLKGAKALKNADDVVETVAKTVDDVKPKTLEEAIANSTPNNTSPVVDLGGVEGSTIKSTPVENTPLKSADLNSAVETTKPLTKNGKVAITEDTNKVIAEDIGISKKVKGTSPKKTNVMLEDEGIGKLSNDGETLTFDPYPGKDVSNTRKEIVNRGLATQEEADEFLDVEDYLHDVMNIDNTMDMARERVKEVGWEQVLKEADETTDDFLQPQQYANLIQSYLDLKKAGDMENAAKVLQRLTKASTPAAQDLRLAREFAQSMPEGKLATTISKAKNAVDSKKKLFGYSDAVDKMADDLSDAIKSGDDNAVKKVLNKKLSDFTKSTRAKTSLDTKQIDGQMSLFDYFKEEKAKGRPLNEIADECGRLLKKKADVVTLDMKQEAEMLGIFNKMSYLEPDSYEYRQLQGQAMQILDKELPVSIGEKIKTTLYDNMLGNFKTAVTRNAGGNLVANKLEQAQKPLRTLLDKALSTKTGKRNYVMGKDIAKARREGFKKGLTEQLSDIKSGVQTTRSGQNSLTDALDAVATAYKGSNKVSKVLGEYDRIVKQAMQIGDRPFYEAAYAETKAQLNDIVNRFGKDALQTVGINPKEVDVSKVDDVIEFWARNNALEAVFQNKSLSTEGFSSLKDFLSKMSKDTLNVDILSQTGMPFMQVPGNIFSRGIQYSPIGILRNAIGTGKELATGNFNQKRFVDETTRNLTGLGLLGGSIALANSGNVTGSYSDDPDKAKAQRDAGELEYALKLGNKQYDVSDLPVFGPLLQAGAAYESSQDENKSALQNIGTGTKEALNAMLETSTLQGLNRLLGTNTYDKSGNIAQNALNTFASGLPSQMIPSLARQITQTIDPNKRELGEYGTPEYYLNSAINSTPLRMALLNEKTDREGNEILQNNGRNVALRALENMVLPYSISEPQYSDVTKEANRLFDENSGDARGYIPNISQSTFKKIKGFDAEDYSYDLWNNYNKQFSKNASADAKEAINSKAYRTLTDDQKAELLSKIYTANLNLIKSEIARYGKSKKEIEKLEEQEKIFTYDDKFTYILKKDGVEAAVEYYKISKAPDVDNSGSRTREDVLTYLKQNGYSETEIKKWMEYFNYKY